jgi:hypothetical protein
LPCDPAETRTMALFRFYLVKPDGHFVRVINRDCENVIDMKAQARA